MSDGQIFLWFFWYHSRCDRPFGRFFLRQIRRFYAKAWAFSGRWGRNSPASQTYLETEIENEKVRALPKTFQHTSDNSFLEEEIPGVDLDNAMDTGAEIQPIEETSLEEIKQSDNFTEVD